MKVLQKAWMIDGSNLWESYYVPDGVILAETRGKAKLKALRELEGFQTVKDNEDVNYLTVRVKRSSLNDIIEVEGERTTRGSLKFKEKINNRLKSFQSLPDDEMFYVQDSRSYVGNSVLWWALNNNGYTTDISKAQKYSKADILNKFKDARDTDIIWIASHVEANIKQHVDIQNINREWSR